MDALLDEEIAAGWMDRWMAGWLDERIEDGWMAGWIGSMDGWMFG